MLSSRESHPPPHCSAAGAAGHFRGAGEREEPGGGTSCPLTESRVLGAQAGEQCLEGRGLPCVHSAYGGRTALPFGRNYPQLPASGEVKSPPGGPEVAAASWRSPDLGVGAATPLPLLRDQGGSCEKEGRPKAAILLLGGIPFSRVVLVWRLLRLLAGDSWSGASDVACRRPSPRTLVIACRGRGPRWLPWALCLTADPWRTGLRGWSGVFSEGLYTLRTLQVW